MKKKYPDLTNSPDWSHLIVHSMADGVITVDSEMHITDLNQAAEKLTGFRGGSFGTFCGKYSKAACADGSVEGCHAQRRSGFPGSNLTKQLGSET
jgi:hypothetical protein